MRIEDKDEREFYEKEAIRSNWNAKTLKRQFHSSLYERLALSWDKNEVMRLANEGAVPQKPQDILHTPYVLEFAGLEDKISYHESDLESAVIEKMQKFLLEVGAIDDKYILYWRFTLCRKKHGSGNTFTEI